MLTLRRYAESEGFIEMNCGLQLRVSQQEHSGGSFSSCLVKRPFGEPPSDPTLLAVRIDCHARELKFVSGGLKEGAGTNHSFSFNGGEHVTTPLNYGLRVSPNFIVRFFELKILLNPPLVKVNKCIEVTSLVFEDSQAVRHCGSMFWKRSMSAFGQKQTFRLPLERVQHNARPKQPEYPVNDTHD